MQISKVTRLWTIHGTDQIVGYLREDNATRFPILLQSRSYIDTITVDVIRRCHHLADVHGDTQSY
jgi:hypothetical protein